MKNNRNGANLLISLLAIFFIFITFSCEGLFTSLSPNDKTGYLTIDLPGSAVRAAPTKDDIEFYQVSVISESTGNPVIPTRRVNPGSFSAELTPGKYSVIVQGMNSQNLSMPMFIGRKNGVTITAGKATTAKVSMVLFQLDFNSTTQVNPTIDVTNIGNGKLPTPSAEGFTFDGWYSDSTLTTPITDFPDTSAGSSFVYPVAKFTKIVVNTLPTGTGIYYAKSLGQGDGRSPDSPKSLGTLLFDTLENYPGESAPRIYLLGNLSGQFEIMRSIHLIGALDGNENSKVTLSGSEEWVVTINSGINCTFTNIIIDGSTERTSATAQARGIINNGNLTLENSIITNCVATNGAGILNNGILTLEEGTSIINCSATGDGKSIYCDYEDGRTVKVNNYDFLSDAWYDSVIDETNPYSNTTWTITPPDTSVEGIYYANASGTGDGTTSEKVRAFSALIADATLKNYSSDGCPRIYLLEDITGSFTISRNVRIESVENEETHEKPTITGSGTPILTISNDVVCIIKGIDINGGISYRGITNNGTLTLNDCSITGRNSEGAGIYNKGTLTLENGTSISRDEYSTKGKSIYCEYVDDKTVKVNNDIFTSDAWYDYSIDTTTPYDRDLWIKTATTGTGIYFAKASGSGDGRSLNNARALSSLLSETLNDSSEGYPVVYLMENITISSGSSGLTISNKVKLIGAKGGVLNERVTIQKNGSSNSDSNTITFGSDSYIVQNVTIHGGGSNRGILNNGTLTLDNCEIKNASTEENGAGILNKGTVTLINGTIISGYATEKGNSIYCDSENGSSVKVNDDTFTSDAWYDDYINATTPYDSNSWRIAMPEGTGIYFANTNGQGDGTSISNPISLNTLISNTQPLTNYPGEDAPRIYLLDDIISALTVKKNVRIIGAKDGVIGQKTTLTRTGSGGTLLTINSSFTCTIEDVIIDGNDTSGTATYQGISNSGTLTLDNCEIKNCSGTSGGGILNKGNLTLQNGTTIKDCQGSKGISIYCDSENGSTVKVNNDTFTSDAWYDNAIDATTPYDSSSWTIGIPEGTGIYFAKASGSGDGRSLNNARALSSLLSETLTNSSEGYPVIYLMEDITISSGSSGLTISNKVKLIGAKGGVLNERVTIQKNGSSNSDSNTITFGSDSYIVQNVTIHGGGSNRGILNNGTLTLDNCEIKNASTEENGAGILNKGTVTLINGTIISGYATEKGNSIYCDSENGSTVKVNNDTFTSDAWYDNAIDATTPYDSSSWTIGIPEGTGLYFARATGDGNGTSPSDAKAFSELISALNSDGLEPPAGSYITIYLLDDISSDSTIEIDRNVRIIGAKNGYLNQKSTITRTDDTSTPVFTISEGKTCFLDDLIIDGSTEGTAETAAYQGILNNGTLTLNKCNIKNCTAANGAGISNSGTAVLTLTDSFIGNCTATTGGGGIYSVSNGSVTLSGTKITGCNVNTTSNEARGGGIYCDTGSLTLKDGSTVSGCNAYNNGGGIFFSSSGTLTITDSTIGGDNESDKCTATYGGGISTRGTGSLEINGTSKIKNCTATKYGGGLYLMNTYDSNQITLNGTTISYCEANDGNSSGDGGGICVKCTANNNEYPALTISNCTFDHCTVREYGGAISIISGTMSVSETTISYCSAVKGGALSCQGTCTLDTGTFFTDCTASNAGGALYAVGSGCNLTLKSNSQIDNCSATQTGGAIFLYNESTVTLESGAQITNCTAPSGGGIALNSNAKLSLKDGAIITGCKANNSPNSLFTISNGIINNSTISGDTKYYYNYDITADDKYNRSKLSTSPSAS